jgi:hypothetical protein
MTTRTYKPNPTYIPRRYRRWKRSMKATIAAMAISNRISFHEQVMMLVRQELGA